MRFGEAIVRLCLASASGHRRAPISVRRWCQRIFSWRRLVQVRPKRRLPLEFQWAGNSLRNRFVSYPAAAGNRATVLRVGRYLFQWQPRQRVGGQCCPQCQVSGGATTPDAGPNPAVMAGCCEYLSHRFSFSVEDKSPIAFGQHDSVKFANIGRNCHTLQSVTMSSKIKAFININRLGEGLFHWNLIKSGLRRSTALPSTEYGQVVYS